MNGELTIRDLFAKYGRRFVETFISFDGVKTVNFYEIITVKGEKPIVKLKTVEFDPIEQELYISNDNEQENWFEAFELWAGVENGIFFPLSMLPYRASKKARISLQKFRNLSLKVFKYEHLTKDLDKFSENYGMLRNEIINALNEAIDSVYK